MAFAYPSTKHIMTFLQGPDPIDPQSCLSTAKLRLPSLTGCSVQHLLTFYGFIHRDGGQLLVGGQVPQDGHLVSASCQQAVSLRREAQRSDCAEVILQQKKGIM